MAEPADSTQASEEPDYKALYEDLKGEVDELKANSRKWEGRSKSNAQKAKLYDELEGKAKSSEERLADIEGKYNALVQEREHAAVVAKVAKATGLPESVVASLNGADEDALTEQATELSKLLPKGAPEAPEAGKFPRNQSATDGADKEQREFVRDLFGTTKK